MLDAQTLLNSAMALLAFLAVWVFKLMWQEISTLKERATKATEERAAMALMLASDYIKKTEAETQFKSIVDKVHRLESLEVVLANQYVTKADFTRVCDQILAKLDKMDAKLDMKADKP
jgi:hypothetical protein